jgi:hypothetical protein
MAKRFLNFLLKNGGGPDRQNPFMFRNLVKISVGQVMGRNIRRARSLIVGVV